MNAAPLSAVAPRRRAARCLQHAAAYRCATRRTSSPQRCAHHRLFACAVAGENQYRKMKKSLKWAMAQCQRKSETSGIISGDNGGGKSGYRLTWRQMTW